MSGPTIYDVAERAGVAPSTVSRALSKPGRVSFETAERVRAAAVELGYRMRTLQRDVRADGGIIALAVADITNPVFSPLIRGAQQTAEEAGHHLMLVDSRGRGEVEEMLLERLLPTVSGVLLTSPRMSDGAIRRLAKQVPLVALNRVVGEVRSVVPDNLRAVRRAAELLGEHGHREIVMLAGPELSWAAGMRWRALREVGHELALRVRRLGPADPTISGGASLFAAWRERPATAVLAYNDLMAIGFIEASRRAGVRVPTDVSVIGFDNIVNGAQMTPALTTMAAPVMTLGVTGVHHLLSVAHDDSAHGPVHLPVRLVLRDSVGPAPR